VQVRPAHLELDRARGLTVRWADRTESFYPVEYLRRMSPSAEARSLRQEMDRNPLTVLPASPEGGSGPLTAVEAQLVGSYAIQIRFSDGHQTGIYSWDYLRQIDPQRPQPPAPDPMP
jgi:DUF971 family protein